MTPPIARPRPASNWRAFPIPARNERYTATDGPDTWWPTPEPPHRINQTFLEPVMFAHAAAMPGVRILNRTMIEDFTQGDHAVDATARDLDSGETFRIEAKYLAGCDGSRSMVRRSDRGNTVWNAGHSTRPVDLHPCAAACSA